MQRSDSEDEEDSGLRPALRSVDAAIALSRRVIKESLDLNSRPGSSTSEPNDRHRSDAIMKRYYEQEAAQLRVKAHSSESLAQEVVALRAQLASAQSNIKALEQERRIQNQQIATNERAVTGKLLELEEVIRALNTELSRKNTELRRVSGLLNGTEEREETLRKELQNALRRLEEIQTASETLLIGKNDTQKSLKEELERARKQAKEAADERAKTLTDLATSQTRAQAADEAAKRLTIQIDEITAAHIEAIANVRVQLAEEENAKVKALRQLQELVETHNRTLEDLTHMDKLRERVRELEATEMQQAGANMRLQEELRRAQTEVEALQRSKMYEGSQMAQKLAALEREFHAHLRRRKY